MATLKRFTARNGLDNNNNSIINVVDPTNAQDVATKNYADTALALKAPLASPTFTGTVSGITKAMVGLSSVDNTADTAKPVSTAQALADTAVQTAAASDATTKANAAQAAAIASSAGSLSTHAGDFTLHLTAGQNTWIDAVTATAVEVNYLGGVTSSIQTQLGTKSPLASPTFTGIPVAPTAVSGTNTTQIATTAFVSTAVADLVASAPATLNTLNELATALGNDAAFSTTITNSIGLKAPLASPTFTGTVSGITAAMVGLGNVTNVAQLAATQTLAITGDATAPTTALNTGTIALTLANSGVTAGTYSSVTVNAKGLVTAATTTSSLGQGAVSSYTLTTSTTASGQVVASVAAATYRTLKVLVQATSGTSYHTTELLLIHDGTTVIMDEYSPIFTGASLVTMDADINTGNVRILTTPTNAATTIKVIVTAINV